jgi:Ubiquitin carboxyl-terminal hydrolase/Zn-finger in ubiquitin-hydrolases and other protein
MEISAPLSEHDLGDLGAELLPKERALRHFPAFLSPFFPVFGLNKRQKKLHFSRFLQELAIFSFQRKSYSMVCPHAASGAAAPAQMRRLAGVLAKERRTAVECTSCWGFESTNNSGNSGKGGKKGGGKKGQKAKKRRAAQLAAQRRKRLADRGKEGKDENLWVCLSCGNVACGRSAEKHGVLHFERCGEKHALALRWERDMGRVWCYACDDDVRWEEALEFLEGEALEGGGGSSAAAAASSAAAASTQRAVGQTDSAAPGAGRDNEGEDANDEPVVGEDSAAAVVVTGVDTGEDAGENPVSAEVDDNPVSAASLPEDPRATSEPVEQLPPAASDVSRPEPVSRNEGDIGGDSAGAIRLPGVHKVEECVEVLRAAYDGQPEEPARALLPEADEGWMVASGGSGKQPRGKKNRGGGGGRRPKLTLNSLKQDSSPLFSSEATHTRASSSHAGARGLRNLGNTCFFNSIVQCMTQCTTLRSYLIEHPENDEREFEVTLAFADFLRQMWHDEESHRGFNTFNPRNFFLSICKKAPRFYGWNQQDAHELLVFLLDIIDVESRQAARERELEATTVSNCVRDVFDGKITSTVTCLECNHTSTGELVICFVVCHTRGDLL